jgi:hypothetical protein
VPVVPPQLEYPRTIFIEHQRPRGATAAIMIGCIVVLALLAFSVVVLGRGRTPIWGMLLFITILAAVCALFFSIRLTVTVSSHDLRLRYFPFWSKRLLLHEIVEAKVTSYRPVWDFGGWGIRWSLRDSSTCYTMHGTRGVYVTTAKGQKLLIGSQRPDELAEAINAARSTLTE